MEKILLALGFKKIRQKGSHAFYKHNNGKVTTVPHHAGQDLSRPLIRTILRDINLTIEDFNKILEKL